MPGRMSSTGTSAADQLGDLAGLGARHAGALQHAGEAVAAAEGGAKVDDRPLGAFGERLDRVGRRHPAAGVGAVGERRDGERARLLELGVANGAGDEAGQRLEAGAERPGGVAERGAGGEAAQPFARADPLAEIDDEVELGERGRASRGSWLPKAGAGRGRPRRAKTAADPSASAALPRPAPMTISLT